MIAFKFLGGINVVGSLSSLLFLGFVDACCVILWCVHNLSGP